MRRLALPALLAAALAVGCDDRSPTPTGALDASVDVRFSKADPKNYHSHATGDQEAPVPRETLAQGQLKLQLSKDGETLSYRLITANIENVFQAHLHLGAAGQSGGIVVWLYPSAPPAVPIPGRSDGVLAEGEITAANLTGALAGQPLSALIEAIEAGNVYVNVHTNDFVAPTNTGPGDFPGGEIRGQVAAGG